MSIDLRGAKEILEDLLYLGLTQGGISILIQQAFLSSEHGPAGRLQTLGKMPDLAT